MTGLVAQLGRVVNPGAGASAPRSLRGTTLRIGGLIGIIGIYLCLVGIVPIFHDRPVIAGIVSIGGGSLLIAYVAAGYMIGRRDGRGSRLRTTIAGGLGGALAGVFLAALVLIGAAIDLRAVFLNASDVLWTELTFGLGTGGFWAPVVAGALFGGIGAFATTMPAILRRPLLIALGALLGFGLFAGLLRTPMLTTPLADVARFLFAAQGLTIVGAVIVFVTSFATAFAQRRWGIRERVDALPTQRRRLVVWPVIIFVAMVVLTFPIAFGPFLAQVVAIVALFILMGLGLNITLGLAGLLDLGFVAFFAVGAYTVGLMTSTAEFGLLDWSFWQAVPFAVLFAMAFGAFLGLPILGIRGDYLAIATLGFGEIIRLLVGSDLLKAWLGGPRGVINIPKPIDVPIGHFLAGPNQIYYIAIVFCVLIAFIAWRLQSSRLGRSWLAIREDEDVAEGMGINLVQTKLLAYMLGAAFAGLGGAVFSGLVGSVFFSSISLIVSINVAAIVIVGGMGSIPGVVLGAIFLIGLPELFREFSEYRFLFYGVALMAMMIYRPEGLFPSQIRRRELHEAAELVDLQEVERMEAEAAAAAEAAAQAAAGAGGDQAEGSGGEART